MTRRCRRIWPRAAIPKGRVLFLLRGAIFGSGAKEMHGPEEEDGDTETNVSVRERGKVLEREEVVLLLLLDGVATLVNVRTSLVF